MEKAAVDNFLSNWNRFFPDMLLTVDDLKKPQMVMAALFHLFDRLRVSRDAVTMAPEDSDEHLIYYRDLLPVVNSIRIVNHVAPIMPEENLSISIMHLLQPTTMRSYTILVVLFNQMVFNESRLEDIAPMEEELFAYKDKVKSLIEKKDNLIQMRNMEAAEKGNRAERLEQMDLDILRLEEELKQEKELEAKSQQELEAIKEENRQTDYLFEQKKAHRDGILAENARKKELRVYDADDIRGQSAQAAQSVREAEDKLAALSATLAQKEASLANLQALRPALDQANGLLLDIEGLADTVKELEGGAAPGAEAELAALRAERAELGAALADARAAAAAAAERRRERAAAARARRAADDSAVQEAEEQLRRARAEAARAAAGARAARDACERHARAAAAADDELAAWRDRVLQSITTVQENLLDKIKDAARRVEEQNQRRRKL